MYRIKDWLKSKLHWLNIFKTSATNFKNALIRVVSRVLMKFFGYWISTINENASIINSYFDDTKMTTRKLVLAGILSALAAILQSAGALGGPGYIISMLATLPVVISTVLSFRTGIMTYITTICLLLIINPGEAAIFPFTTGLLGAGLGQGLRLFKKRIVVMAFAALFLTVGITILLCVLRFPVLGPSISTTFELYKIASIYAFSFFYSWLWIEFSIFILKILKRWDSKKHFD